MQEVREEKVDRPPLLLTAIGCVLFGIIGTAWTLLQPDYTMAVLYNLSLSACALVLSVLPINLIFLACILGKFKPLKKRINLRSLTYLYVFAIAAMFYNNEAAPSWQIVSIVGERYSFPVTSNEYVPLFLAPSLEVVQKFRVGGYAVPWADYAPMIIWWWLVTTLPALFAMSLSVIFRKRWTDVEKVPFPQTMVAHNLMTGLYGGSEKPLWIKLFSVGVILGFAVQIPIFMASVFPWFPDIYGWRTNTCRMGSTQVTADSPLAGIAGLTTWGKYPPHAAIGYLAPLNILLSFLICYFVLIIIGTQVAYALGYYTGITGVGGCGRAWCAPPIGLMVSDPFKWNATGQLGGIVGLSIFMLIGSRRYIVDTAKAALGRLDHNRIKEMESSEPMSYRSAYMMMSISAILFIAFWMASGFSLLGAILMLLTLVLVFWSTTRIYGLVGFAVSPGLRWSAFLYQGLMWPTIPTKRSPEWVTSMFIANEFGSDLPELGWGGSLFSSFASYRMASLTGVSSRNVLKVWTIVAILLPLVSVMSCLWVIHIFGIGKTSMSTWVGNWNGITAEMESGNRPTAPPWIPYALLGIAIVGILSLLHTTFMWWPVDPAGYVLATTIHPLLEGLWLPFLIAWVAKTITLRVGGSKAYENYGVPIATGFLAGTTLVILIGGGIGIYRFFLPF